MDYLQSLLFLDGVAIAGYDRLLKGEEPGGHLSDDERLLLALHAEVETVATLTAVSTSIANTLTLSEGPRPSPRSLVTFSPPDLAVYAVSTNHLLSSDIAVELVAALQEMGARIALAKQMSRAFAAEAATRAKSSSVDVEALSYAWRKACVAAATALSFLASELGGHEAAPGLRPASGLKDLKDLLTAAAGGHHPCVEPDGCVIVPGWAERRQHKRITTELTAEAKLGLTTHPVRIFAVSAGGMGLIGLTNPRRGDSVTVCLESGRRLRGTVAWVAGERAGLRFNEALPRTDALLCE